MVRLNCGKASNFMGERQSSVLVPLKKSLGAITFIVDINAHSKWHYLCLSGIGSAFNWWWPFWARIRAITRQFTRSVRPCSVDYKKVDRRLQMLDKDYKIPDCGKPSIFVGERQSSALVLLKKSLRSRVINESLRKLRGLVIPDFLIIFTLITILGNAHRRHKYYPIITTIWQNF